MGVSEADIDVFENAASVEILVSFLHPLFLCLWVLTQLPLHGR